MSFGAVLSMQLQEKARMKAFVSPPFTCPLESSSQGCVKYNYSRLVEFVLHPRAAEILLHNHISKKKILGKMNQFPQNS